MLSITSWATNGAVFECFLPHDAVNNLLNLVALWMILGNRSALKALLHLNHRERESSP